MSDPHALVDEHFAGRGTADGDARMWRHLPGCERCRARYRARTLLESLEPDGGERARERMARAVFARRRPRPALWAGGLAAAAALVLLVAWPRDDFRSRGGDEVSSAARPALSIFRVPPGGAAERVGAVVRAGDGLAFAYRSPAPAGATHLMVFATDRTGRVYWFWPAFTDPASDPAALAIGVAETSVELPEAIRHRLPSGPLTMHALFARRPYRVSEIEAAVAARGLAALDGVLLTEPLEVTP
jgi:hypothetical protein